MVVIFPERFALIVFLNFAGIRFLTRSSKFSFSFWALIISLNFSRALPDVSASLAFCSAFLIPQSLISSAER